MKKLFGLSHITTENNCNSIIKKSGFSLSVISDKSIQWLGNGVYFWNNSDDDSIIRGKFMAESKKISAEEKIKIITVNLEMSSDNYVDLDCQEWDKNFAKFLKKIPEKGNDLLKKLNHIKSYKSNIKTKEQNEIYGKFGELIDMFVNELSNEYNIEVHLLSYSFYTGTAGRMLVPCERRSKQFCLKKIELVNNNFKEWIIEDI